MLPFFQENLLIFTGKFFVFRRKTHDFSSKSKNQSIDKKISIPEKSIDTSPITRSCILLAIQRAADTVFQPKFELTRVLTVKYLLKELFKIENANSRRDRQSLHPIFQKKKTNKKPGKIIVS